MVERARSWTADPMRASVGAAAARRCALLVAQNEEEAARLRDLGPPVVIRPNVFLEDDFGTAPDNRSLVPPIREDAPRAVFAGRLVAWKGVYLALSVLARPEMASWHLDVFGAGPERGRLLRKIRRLGLADRVVLHGKRPRDEVESALRGADAFLFPSMREAAGWVVAEALAVGCHVICLDSAGPPILLRGTGMAVPPGPTMVEDLARAIAAARSGPRTVVRWDQSEAPAVLRDWYSYADRSDTGAVHRLKGALTQ
jgi:glycosyltransferase involved in cell wall biosynthesis